MFSALWRWFGWDGDSGDVVGGSVAGRTSLAPTVGGKVSLTPTVLARVSLTTTISGSTSLS